MNRIPSHKEGVRLLDFEGAQAASGWVDVTSTGTFTITDNPGKGVVGSTNGVKFTQSDATATRLVRAYYYNASGWDCSKSDIWTLSALYEQIPSQWRVGSNGVELCISSDGPGVFTNNKLITLLNGTETGLPVYGKNVMSWTNADWGSSGGTINMSSVKNVRLRFNTTSAADAITFTGLWNGRVSLPMVAVTFDDANAGDVTAASIANAQGVPITSFVIPDLVGNPPTYLTEAEIATIASAYNGMNAICGHNQNTLWNQADYGAADVAATVSWLKERGYDWQYYAYPGGGFNSNVWDVMRANGIIGARTIRGISYTAGPPTLYASRVSYEGVSTQVEGIPDPLQVNASPLSSVQTLAQAKAALDKAIKKGESIIFYGHKLGGAADTSTWTTSDFTELIAYISQKVKDGLIEAVNIPQFYEKNMGERVAI